MLQHAIFTIPNRAEGYTTDDNARALIFTVLLKQLGSEQTGIDLSAESRTAQPGLGFPVSGVPGACLQSKEEKVSKLPRLRPPLDGRPGIGRFSRPRVVGTWNSFWAVTQIMDCEAPPDVCSSISLPAVVEFHSPRACAYALLGIQEYLHSYPGDRDAQRVRFALAQRLLDMYESIQRPDWKWFEDVVAYGNARLPQAMLLVGSACGNERMLSAGLDSLDWLMETQNLPDQWPLRAGRLARILPPGW